MTPRLLSSLPPQAGWEGAVSRADAASAPKVPVPLRGSEAACLEPRVEGGRFRTDGSPEASEARAALAFPPCAAQGGKGSFPRSSPC